MRTQSHTDCEEPCSHERDDTGEAPSWIVCQLGAREHYAVPRALRMRGNLALFVTDLWLGRGAAGWGGRRDAALAEVPRVAFNGVFLPFQAMRRLATPAGRVVGDTLTGFADGMFQRCAARTLRRWEPPAGRKAAVFCYSYSARRPFREARRRGWRTVLGQINPGPREEEIVREVYRAEFGPDVPAPDAPAAYWSRWREECALADVVVANSGWSRQLLVEAGIEEGKIAVVPLAYAPPAEAVDFQREYPGAFTRERPLRVLFLGAAHPRKGVHILLRAAAALAAENAPVRFLLVGRDEMPGGLANRLPSNTCHIAEVDRRATGKFYREADVFILPTFSDGFALTLLEAQAWQLPVIASRHCGEVVRDGVNGLELAAVTAEAVAGAVLACAADAVWLQEFAARSVDFAPFSLDAIGARLDALGSVSPS